MIREKIVAGVKIVLFLGIGVVLFQGVQEIVTPKYVENNFEQFYALEEDSLDAVFLGTSHMQRAYSPMEVYEKYGISTYNLSTDLQPIPVSYYLTQEILDYQKPKVIVLDASNLFLDSNESATNWRYTMDSMAYGSSHAEMAEDFGGRFKEEDALSALIPMLRYHTRWNELNEQDFQANLEEYCLFGQELFRQVISPPIDEVVMNELTIQPDEYYEVTEIEEGTSQILGETISHAYTVEIPEENLQYLLKIKETCEAAGVDFLLTKIPSIQYPEGYSSAWTRQRSDMTKQVCAENGIEFIDLLYDDTGYIVDYQTDFQDGGYHLSFRGAEKVSDFFGNFLVNKYKLTQKLNMQFEEKRALYDIEKEEVLLCTELDYNSYMDRVQTYLNAGNTVFVCGSANMLSRLGEEQRGKFWNLGFQTDFLKYSQGGYVACAAGKEVLYEAYSTLTTSYEYPMEDDEEVELEATGRENSWYTSITFPFTDEEGNEVNFTRYDSSLTIVVYSPEDEEILDNAYFILNEDGTVSRVWQ